MANIKWANYSWLPREKWGVYHPNKTYCYYDRTAIDINDKDELSKDFMKRLDNKKTFFLRLDKQKAYLGKIKLSNIDPILIKIKLNFFPNNFKEIINPNK